MTLAAAPRTHAGSVSRILSKTELKKQLPGNRWSAGYEVVQSNVDVTVHWVQGRNTHTCGQALQVMRAALAPRGYKIETASGGRIDPRRGEETFVVTKTTKLEEAPVRIALQRGNRTSPSSAMNSGWTVGVCEVDDRFVKVSYWDHAHTTYVGDDREAHVSASLKLYTAILLEAGYAVSRLKGEEAILVGVKGSKGFPTTSVAKPREEALQALRDALEFEFLDVYTRMAPGRNSVFVLLVTTKDTRRLEIFYIEETGEYRAMPWGGGYFGALKSRDLGKVQDFVRTELEG